ncbi:MAG: alpha-N-arabinofuranosidase [Candidatus Sumerlaeota bacterium]|nr:alpha-N-arabinofuranosidase [Candidatus Sumerlaeota bacterium]
MPNLQNTTITVQADRPARAVSPILYGIFYEEINHAGDGGIYAEMVQNRSFEDTQLVPGARIDGDNMVTARGWRTPLWFKSELHGWSRVADGGASITLRLDSEHPLNGKAPHSMRVDIAAAGQRAGVTNRGYWGMAVRDGAMYDLSFFARCEDDGEARIAATLESEDGRSTFSRCEVSGVSGDWRRYACNLRATGADPKARLALTFDKPGTYWLDVVSLFARDTYKNRPNGMRPDLVQLLLDLKPAFLRFPGGCVVEGCTLDNRIKWKNTIGDITNRPGRWNLWGYRNTEGLGFHEYLLLAEDLDAEPLYVVNAGMSCQARPPAETVDDPAGLQTYIQDMLDALEYANGLTTTKWGAERARNGHPEPFGIKYVEIGNENSGPDYESKYRAFVKALKERHPAIVPISNTPIPGAVVEVVDEHYYNAPAFFFWNAGKYDGYDRKGPRIYVGEYACNSGVGSGNLLGALSEAAFMTGMERNSDIVTMASYAPLFENVNDRTWPVNLIRFDSSRACGRTSYHVQRLFGNNRPDVTYPVEVADSRPSPTQPHRHGRVGLGTWATQAEYKDVKVTRDGHTLYGSDFTSGSSEWKAYGGDWSVRGGALRQSDDREDRRITVGDPQWSDYTYSFKARKLGGVEGFLAMFLVGDDANWVWWNIGGFGNSCCALEQCVEGAKSIAGLPVPFHVETGRWYDVRIEVAGSVIRCFLDGKLIETAEIGIPPTLFATAGFDRSKSQLVVKVVNATAQPADALLRIEGLTGIAPRGESITLCGEKPTDENTLDEPDKVTPVTAPFENAGGEMRYSFRPYSVTVLRLDAAQSQHAPTAP